MATLTGAEDYAGCEAPDADWSAKGLLVWDGDWLLINPAFDVFGTDLPPVFEAISPWPSLGAASDVAWVELAVTAEGSERLHTEATSSAAEWLALRDPTGTMRSNLEAVDAFADGYVDIGEAAAVMASGLDAEGIDASVFGLDDPSTTHEVLAGGDVDVLIDHLLALAGS